MMTRRRILQIFAAAVVAPTAARAVERRTVMGADVAITLQGPASVTEPALAAAWTEIDRIENLFSLYRERSAINRLNASGYIDNPDPDFVALLQLCGRIHTATSGRFDPTIQPLWLAHANGDNVVAARELVGFDRVHIDEGLIRLGEGQALTLNGIAQGFATDRVTHVLRSHGLDRALVNIGEYAALSGPWRLGIEDPAFGQVGQISLQDRAAATSSPGAMRLADGSSHIIDPTGMLVVPEWSTVSVCAPSAALADGLSTALCQATLNEIPHIAARIGEPLAIRLVDLAGNLRTL